MKNNNNFINKISSENEQDACDSNTRMFHIFIYFQSEILVSGMSTVWEDTNGCAKKYRCYLAVSIMAVLSSSYDNIIYIVNKCTWSWICFCWCTQCNGQTLFEGRNGTYW